MHGVSNEDGGTRLADKATLREKEKDHVSGKGLWLVRCTVHVPGRNSRRKPMRARGCVPVKSPKVTFGWKCGFARKCADAGLAEAGGRRAVLAELAESEFDTKKNLL